MVLNKQAKFTVPFLNISYKPGLHLNRLDNREKKNASFNFEKIPINI